VARVHALRIELELAARVEFGSVEDRGHLCAECLEVEWVDEVLRCLDTAEGGHDAVGVTSRLVVDEEVGVGGEPRDILRERRLRVLAQIVVDELGPQHAEVGVRGRADVQRRSVELRVEVVDGVDAQSRGDLVDYPDDRVGRGVVRSADEHGERSVGVEQILESLVRHRLEDAFRGQ
jgi:hypothetical protein